MAKNKLPIWTRYKDSAGQHHEYLRGVFKEDTKEFIRVKTPLIRNRDISFEPDVVEQLKVLGCKELVVTLRAISDKIIIPFDVFLNNNFLRYMNAREQHFFDIIAFRTKKVPVLSTVDVIQQGLFS